MKRALAFLALAGSGTFLLWRLDESFAPGPGREGPDFLPTALAGPDEHIDAPIVPGGAVRWTSFDDQGNRAYQLKSPELTFEGGETGLTRMNQLEALVDNPETGNLLATIRSAEGSGKIEDANVKIGGDQLPQLADDTIYLTDVEVVISEGAPVVPLTVQVPTLIGNLRTRYFTSTDDAVAEGPGFEATGTGITLDLANNLLSFNSTSRVEFEREDGETARLEANGSLAVQRDATTDDVEFNADDRAKLWLEGERPVYLGGNSLSLTATNSSAEDDSGSGFELQSVRAVGRAHIELPEGRFSADTASFEAGPDKSHTARLEGSPSSEFTLRRPGSSSSARGLQPFVKVTLSGRGPMVVEESQPFHFEIQGPATALWEDETLYAAGGLRGWISEAQDEATLSAWTEVELKSEHGQLDTNDLTLEVLIAEDGTRVSATSNGVSTLNGVTTDGERFEVRAAEQLIARQDPDGWSVPLASGVEIELGGEAGVFASADIIREFRGETWAFQAEGEVRARNGELSAVGNQLTSFGRDHAVLIGGTEPAIVEWENGWARAERIEMRPGKLTAAIGVEASIDQPGFQGDVTAANLEVRRTEVPEPGGVTRVALHMRAAGNAELRATEQPFSPLRGTKGPQSLSAELFDGHYHELRDSAGEFLSGELSFQADGAVKAQLELDESVQTLWTDSLYFEANLGAGRLPGEWNTVARGHVRIDRGAGSRAAENAVMASGEGDLLHINSFGEARLEALDGGSVETHGRLPGGRYPFSLAGPWVEFSAEKVRAADFVLRIRELALLPGSEPSDSLERADRRPETDVLVTAESLSCGPSVLLFEGLVHLESVDVSDTTWSLDAAFLQVGNPNLTNAGTGAEALRSFEAWGGVELVYGPLLQAGGDRLRGTLASGRVLIEGTPADIRLPQIRLATDALEYDVRIGIPVSMAAGRAELDGGNTR